MIPDSELYSNVEREKFLTRLIGDCWHESDHSIPYHDNEIVHICKCGEYSYHIHPWDDKNNVQFRQKNDFSTPDGFFKLLNWLKQQDHHVIGAILDQDKEKPYTALGLNPVCIKYQSLFLKEIDPDKFANKVFNFLKEKPCLKSLIEINS